MKALPLTRGQTAWVDDDVFEKVRLMSWQAQRKHAGKFYAVHADRRRPIALHRLVMNAPENMEVDHINGDTLDNRRVNLRICTDTENKWNRGKPSNNTSGYKGVYWRKSRRRWQASIGVHHKFIYLGSFTDPAEAAKAYDEAAIKYHGDFAFTNFE